MDARIDGMLYAAIQHPPVLGSKVKTFDDKGPLQVKGVQKVIPLDTFNSAPVIALQRFNRSVESLWLRTIHGRRSREERT